LSEPKSSAFLFGIRYDCLMEFKLSAWLDERDREIFAAMDTASNAVSVVTLVERRNGHLTILHSRIHDSRTHDDLLGDFTMEVFLHQPELDFARSGAEFNEEFSPTALTRLAQARMNRRLDAKRIRQLRYRRMMHRRAAH
jgi:hypothetical protein